MTMMEPRKWWIPAAAAASSALFLALCAQSCASFQTATPYLAVPTRLHPQASRSIGELFATSGSDGGDEKKGGDCDCSDGGGDNTGGPDILQPYLPAMDPMYPARGPVGEKDFLLSRSGPPSAEELSNEQMLKIVKIECTDLEVNTLVWKCLGYRFNEEAETWSPDEVFPNWKEKFPDPPDLIGMKRVYSREVDQPSLRSNQALVRSIPQGNKQSLKAHLKPLGWKGFQYKELTPNKTRRAQCANWLIFYREELFGYTLDELRERRRLRREAEAAADAKRLEEEEEGGKKGSDWKPPVKEVY